MVLDNIASRFAVKNIARLLEKDENNIQANKIEALNI